MHVLMVMVGGLVLLGVFVLFGWLWGANVAGMALLVGGMYLMGK